MTTAIHFEEMDTPIGKLLPAWRDETLVAVAMGEAVDRASWTSVDRRGPLESALKRMIAARFGDVALERAPRGARIPRLVARYFEGDLEAIREIEVDPAGSKLQSKIWSLLREIPAGRTWTYGELAVKAGAPSAARAAGGIVGANPIPVVIPCHRVLGKSGSLTGFGGGLRRKQWLLEHEGVLLRL